MKNRWIVCAAVAASALTLSASVAFAKTFKVGPGRDFEVIQDAVDAAGPGDKVVVYPGTYGQDTANDAAVYITKSLKLIAKSNAKDPAKEVKIVPGAGHLHGILAEGAEGDPIIGLRIKGFTVEGFPNNGIYTRYVQDFKIDKNISINNLENGIWPTLSADGQVKKNISYGSDDSALWVEASTDVRVQKNELYDSVTGLEVTISENVLMDKNVVYNNTVGVGLYHPNGAGMPTPPGLISGGWTLKKNLIYSNNRPNSAPPGSLAGALPPGGGILIFGVDAVQVERNEIYDNDFYGVALVNYCAGVEGGPNDCDLVPPLVPGHPELNRIEKNEIYGNGTNPVAHALADYAADITFVGLDDLFTPAPYLDTHGKNVLCGTKPPGYTVDGIGIGTDLIHRAKC